MPSLYKRKSDKRRKGSRWIVRWRDAETGKWRDKTAYTDRDASLELGRNLERESARKAEGLTDPLDAQRRRPVSEHMDEFIAKLKTAGRDARYRLQVENRINRVINGIGAKLLTDLDPMKVSRYLSELRVKGRALSGATRNEYVGSLRAFTNWAVESRRIHTDPLVSLKRTERRVIKPEHPRRALSAEDIGALLDAAERRPLLELRTIRRGPDKDKQLAKVKPATAAKANRLGRERRLCYLLAVWTGLRRSEIAALTWGDVDIEGALPRIRLRAETTKSRRADTLTVHPQLADELAKARPADVKANTPIVRTVPGMAALKADLKFAGIEYGTRATGYADFHALRKSLSTMMAAAGMSQRARQAHMRHTDPRLTEGAYMDEALLPIASELAKLPSIPKPDDASPESLPFAKTGTDAADTGSCCAANIQQERGSNGHDMAGDDTTDPGSPGTHRRRGDNLQRHDISGIGSKRQRPAPSGTGRISKAGDEIRTHDIHVGNVTLYH